MGKELHAQPSPRFGRSPRWRSRELGVSVRREGGGERQLSATRRNMPPHPLVRRTNRSAIGNAGSAERHTRPWSPLTDARLRNAHPLRR
jgi:hypothetical protein